jgi:DNA-binding phage protein
MTITRAFKETVQARVQRDPAFRRALFIEGVQSLMAGEVDAGKLILRDYIKATGGFEQLGADTDIPPKSLMRMFSERGNPTARHLFGVIARLQQRDKLLLEVRHAK